MMERYKMQLCLIIDNCFGQVCYALRVMEGTDGRWGITSIAALVSHMFTKQGLQCARHRYKQ